MKQHTKLLGGAYSDTEMDKQRFIKRSDVEKRQFLRKTFSRLPIIAKKFGKLDLDLVTEDELKNYTTNNKIKIEYLERKDTNLQKVLDKNRKCLSIQRKSIIEGKTDIKESKMKEWLRKEKPISSDARIARASVVSFLIRKNSTITRNQVRAATITWQKKVQMAEVKQSFKTKRNIELKNLDDYFSRGKTLITLINQSIELTNDL